MTIKNIFKSTEELNNFRDLIKEKGLCFDGKIINLSDLQNITYRLKVFNNNEIDYNFYCSTSNYDSVQKILHDFSFIKNVSINVSIQDIQSENIILNGVKLNIIHNPEIKGFLVVQNSEFVKPEQSITSF